MESDMEEQGGQTSSDEGEIDNRDKDEEFEKAFSSGEDDWSVCCMISVFIILYEIIILINKPQHLKGGGISQGAESQD